MLIAVLLVVVLLVVCWLVTPMVGCSVAACDADVVVVV